MIWLNIFDLFFICIILIRENNKVKVCKCCVIEVVVLFNINRFVMRFMENRRNLGDVIFLVEIFDD